MDIARIKAYMQECLEEANIFREENIISAISNVHVAFDCLEEFRIIIGKLSMYQTEFAVRAGQQYTCEDYKKCMTDSRKYIRDLRTRTRELDYNPGMEKSSTELEVGVRIAEGSAALVHETIMQYVVDISEYADYSCNELDDAIDQIQSALKEFCLEHVKLSALLGDQYGDTRQEFQGCVTTEAKNMILSLKNLVGEKRVTQVKAAEIERLKQAESENVLGNQLANEIKLRCESLSHRVRVDPVSLPDSKILDFNAGFCHLDNDVSRILEKLTEYSRHAVELGANEQLKTLNVLLNRTIGEKDDFIMAVRRSEI